MATHEWIGLPLLIYPPKIYETCPTEQNHAICHVTQGIACILLLVRISLKYSEFVLNIDANFPPFEVKSSKCYF